MTLKDLNTGESGIVVKVRGREAFHKRLTEMGFVRGQKVEMVRCAPFGDPIEYRLMGYEISLRRNEAELIEIISTTENAPEKEARFAYHG
ncbi:MAG: ferrous iron transport protein A, partial [Bacteroidales bacterium]|nr:ferrous iron transport protein A [Bacteroidales bacterium]